MSFEEITIEELWRYLKVGNGDALQELYRRFSPLIDSESKIQGQINEDLRQDIYERLFIIVQTEISKIEELDE